MKNLKHLTIIAVALISIIAMGACQKMILDDENPEGSAASGNVIIKASMYNIVPFDVRAVQNIADYCSTIQFIFYQDGTKKKQLNQKKGESNYGEASLTLTPGTYQVLVLAHSCPLGNPTVSNPEDIQFSNKGTGYSDTFYYYGDIEVTKEQKIYDIMLERAVSMVRLIITDDIPSNVASIYLRYEGESGHFNATTGWGGSTNSKQSINYNVKNSTAPLTLRAYTFLRKETGVLKMTITAYDTNNVDDPNAIVIAEKTLESIPVMNHMVTEIEGKLFSEDEPDESSASFNLTADTAWEVYQKLNL